MGSILVALMVLVGSSPAWSEHSDGVVHPPETILILNSYHKGFSWSDSVLRGIEETFANSPRQVELLIEYMDTKHHPDAGHWQNLSTVFRHKYAGREIDAIITSDDNALAFLLQNHQEIFVNVPAVFCGINDFKPEMLDGHPNITGVAQYSDFEDTVRLIQRLHPDTQRVIIILPDTVTGLHDQDLIESFADKISDRIQIDVWLGLPIEETLRRVEALEEGNAILVAGITKSSDGRIIPNAEKAERISSVAHVPVYGVRTPVLGHGVVGGRMVDGVSHGSAAAKLALEILAGRPAKEIPVLTTSQNPYMFDFTVMERFGISQDALPQGSIVINLPEESFKHFRTYLGIAMGIILILGIFIASLIFLIAKGRVAEEALRESQELFSAYVKHSTTGIFLKDLEGRYLFVNETMSKRYGTSVENLKGQRFSDLQPAPIADAVAAHDRDVVATLTAQEREIEMVHVDGTTHTHLDIKFPVFDGHGDLKGIGAVSTDITQLKEANEAARELQTELAYVARLSTMGEMAAGFAHELNQPLAAIGNFAKGCVLRLKSPQPNIEAIVTALEEISAQAQRASGIISRIRGFVGKKDGTRKSTSLPPIDINTAIEAAVGLLAGDILKHGASMRMDLQPNLPLARADTIQIQQLVINLARNSMEAMDEAQCHRRNLTIRTLANDQDTVEVHVLDTGPGIPDDVLPRMFHPFFTTKESGMGMGLSICRSIVDQHGGELLVSNREQGGAAFRVVLSTAERESAAA